MSGPVVGVIGGGQLARMMAAPATALGVELRVLVEEPSSSAAGPAHRASVGAADQPGAVLDLADGCDVVTYEHEHIPADVLDALDARGVAALPSAGALVHAQDKIVMRQALDRLQVPVPRWADLEQTSLPDFLAQVGGTAVVKTARGGYDGKGVRVVTSPTDVEDWQGTRLLVEEKVEFSRELAVLVARRPNGQISTWPVVESVQEGSVCTQVVAPAPDLAQRTMAEAERIGRAVAQGLDVVGVLAVELFEMPDGSLLVNELAMRPHNSGHWTIDGSVTSQFEQHLRAVLDLPLGETSARSAWSVMVNVLGSRLREPTDALPDVLADPGVRVHLYDKDVRPGRKLGHVTVCGDDLRDVRARANAAAALLRGERAASDTSGRIR